MSSFRAAVETATIGCAVSWIGWKVSQREENLVKFAALVVQFSLLVLLRWRARLPSEWLAVSRSSPDNGVIYTILTSCVFSTLHEDVRFWTCLALSSGFLLDASQAHFSQVPQAHELVRDSAVISATWLMQQWLSLPGLLNVVCIALFCRRFLAFTWHKAFDKSFTVGEAFVVIDGLALVMTDFLVYTMNAFKGQRDDRSQVVVALQAGLLGVLSMPVVLSGFFSRFAVLENETVNVDPRRMPSPSSIQRRRVDSQTTPVIDWTSDTLTPWTTSLFYAGTAVWLGVFVSPLATMLLDGTNPILWVRDYTFSETQHALTLLYWVGCLVVGLPLIHHIASSKGSLPLIITRKLYHILALTLFGPAMVLVPDFMALSFGISCALLLFVEYVRICRVPPLGRWIHFYLRGYTDSRDEGTTILTHIYLLLGCAMPVWVFPSGVSFAPYAGLIILGAGDAAGAIVGSTVGQMHWPGGRKTLEGTVAALVASLLVLGCFVYAINPEMSSILVWQELVLATGLTCLLEAFTKQIDNLMLPLFYASLLASIGF